MPVANHPTDPNKVVERSSTLTVVPNKWGLYNKLGIFKHEYSSQKVVKIPRIVVEENLIKDRNWDERNNATGGGSRSYLLISIPHFPLDESITANDIDGVVAWNEVFSGVEVETVSTTRMRKMEQIRRDHALTLEYARAELVRDGTVYAPSGTMTQSYGPTYNMYTEFGITRTSFDLDLTTLTVDPLEAIEPIIAHIQDNANNGGGMDGILAICHPTLFGLLIAHPFVKDAYKAYQQSQGDALLSGRLTAKSFGLDARFREFYFGGITFIEYRGSTAGVAYMTAGEARCFPYTEEDLFKTYFAPANRFETIGKPAKEAYWFEYMDEENSKIKIQSESNYINFCTDPAVVVRLFNS